MARRSLDRFDENSPLAATVRRLCLADFDGPATTSFDAVAAWQPLLDRGTELWLDTGDANAAAALGGSLAALLPRNSRAASFGGRRNPRTGAPTQKG